MSNVGITFLPEISPLVTRGESGKRKKIVVRKIKKPTILNMIGFRFILDARLLITGIINNESCMS